MGRYPHQLPNQTQSHSCAERLQFSAHLGETTFQLLSPIGNCSHFREIVPVTREGSLRVTQPSAMVQSCTIKLACLSRTLIAMPSSRINWSRGSRAGPALVARSKHYLTLEPVVATQRHSSAWERMKACLSAHGCYSGNGGLLMPATRLTRAHSLREIG